MILSEKRQIWLRDKFAAWFTGSFVMVGIFIAIMCAVGVGVIWDGYFSRSLSPNEELENSFQIAGWVISAMAILSVAVGLKAILDGARWSGSVFVFAGTLAAIASWSQSIGVMSIAIEDKYQSVEVVERFEATVQNADTAYLEELRNQRAALKAKRDADINQLEATIAGIRDDGVDGIGRADLAEIGRLQDKIDETQRMSDAAIAVLSADIRAELEKNRNAISAASAPTVSDQQKFNPLFPLFASFRYGSDPTDEQVREVAVGFSVFWAALIPAFGMLLSVYLVITRHAARKRNALERELEEKIKRSKAAQKGARTRKENANIYDVEPEEPKALPQPNYLESDLYEDESDENSSPAH